MVTLEMVPLRSKMPHTGRVTLRYPLPIVTVGGPADLRAAQLPRIATTPQVEAEDQAESPVETDLETTAGKGGEAR